VSTIEELLERKSSGSGIENREYSRRISHVDHVAPSARNVGTNFTNKRRLLGRYSFLADSGHGVLMASDGSAVGIETGYGLGDREVGVRVPVGSRILTSIVQTGSGAHPASYPMGTGGSSSGVKLQRREADHSPPTSAEVKKTSVYTSTLQDIFNGVVIT
jgi:hypothetical protein